MSYYKIGYTIGKVIGYAAAAILLAFVIFCSVITLMAKPVEALVAYVFIGCLCYYAREPIGECIKEKKDAIRKG